MKYPARTPMHRFRGALNRAAKIMGNTLESKTDAEYRNARSQDDLSANAEIAIIVRTAGTGRENDALRIEREYLFPGYRVVLYDNRAFAINPRHELQQIECKRIVIIDDQSFHEAISHTSASMKTPE